MDTKILEQIGLSRNEIKVYFALLKLDQASATPIVKSSGIPNSKVYPVLEKLIQKGLVSFVVKNNVRYFQASDPRNLIGYINSKEKELVKQKSVIEKLVSQIETRRKLAKEKQEATIYEGLEGVKAAFNNILDTVQGGEYLVFTLGEELGTTELKRFFKNYHRKRIKKRINVRLIINRRIRQTFAKYHVYKGMKAKYTDLRLPTGIFIFGDNVMTVVWGERPTAFVVTSKNNSESYKQFFEEMWKVAKK